MTYMRPDVYPNGLRIPASLPPSYQPASLGNAPAGERCGTCLHYNMSTGFCNDWYAVVRPRYWCEAWKSRVSTGKPEEIKMYKRISTTTLEEHFNGVPVSLPKKYNEMDENEEDVIKVNVPLMIRLLEYAREDSNKDVELHFITERLIELSEYGDTLDMSNYSDIVTREVETEEKKEK